MGKWIFVKFQQKITFLDSMNRILNIKEYKDLFIVFISIIFTGLLFKVFRSFFHKKVVLNSLETFIQFDIENLKANSLFFKNSIFFSFISESLILSIIFITTTTLFILFRNKIMWSDITDNKSLRILILLTTLIFTYTTTFSSFNYFTGNAAIIDRVLIIIFSILVYFSPLFLFYFFPILFLNYASSDFPLNEFSYTDKLLPLSIIIFTFCLALFHTILKNKIKFQYEKIWLLGSLIIIFGSYFSPFLTKVLISPNLIDWFIIEDFGLALERYIARGWLLNLNQDIIGYIKDFVFNFQKPLLFISFIFEGIAIFLFLNRKISILIISLFTILNIAIFSLSAIFFWKWILFNLMFIGYLIFTKPNFDFKNKGIVITFSIIVSFTLAIFPKLGWYSMPYTLNYSLIVEDKEGTNYNVKGNEMAPFDIYFTFSRWDVLDKNQLPTSTSNYDELKFYRSLNTEELIKYQKKNGQNRFNQNKLNKLEFFLSEYFKNFNKKISSPHFYFKPYSHIQTQVKNKFLFDKKVKKVKIVATEYWFEKNKISSRQEIIKTITL